MEHLIRLSDINDLDIAIAFIEECYNGVEFSIQYRDTSVEFPIFEDGAITGFKKSDCKVTYLVIDSIGDDINQEFLADLKYGSIENHFKEYKKEHGK